MGGGWGEEAEMGLANTEIHSGNNYYLYSLRILRYRFSIIFKSARVEMDVEWTDIYASGS